jgi:hypothetical protein
MLPECAGSNRPRTRHRFPQISSFSHRYFAVSNRISSVAGSRLTEYAIDSRIPIKPNESGDQ